MRGGGTQGADVGAEKKGLAVLQVHVSFGYLGLAGPHALDLPAHEGYAGFEVLFDEVIEARFAIHGDRRQFVGSLHLSVGVYRFANSGARAFAGEFSGRGAAARGEQRLAGS